MRGRLLLTMTVNETSFELRRSERQHRKGKIKEEQGWEKEGGKIESKAARSFTDINLDYRSRLEAPARLGRRHPVLIPLQKLDRHPRADILIATNRFVVVDNDHLDVPELSLNKLQEPLSESRVIAVRFGGNVAIPAIAEPELNVM